jgi:hypothetical protein
MSAYECPIYCEIALSNQQVEKQVGFFEEAFG